MEIGINKEIGINMERESEELAKMCSSSRALTLERKLHEGVPIMTGPPGR